MSTSLASTPSAFIRRRALRYVLPDVPKAGIVKALIRVRGRPSRSMVLAATISACVESSPPDTPITRLGMPEDFNRWARP